MRTLDHFDVMAESYRLKMLQRDMEAAERKGLAIQAALSEHSVVSYIKGLPVEDASYPAIEYLRLTEPDNTNNNQKNNQGNNQQNNQENTHQEGIPDLDYIQWCMPAHDINRPQQKGCGFIISKDGDGIVYSACPNEKEHYIKGKRMHCWSLRCPQCMNDTALKKGVKIERQLLLYKGLSKKQDIDVGDIGHWVISPLQDLAKSMVQTKTEYDRLAKHIDSSVQLNGATAGVTIFHPWRQRESEWEFSPHFHLLCYGRINTNKFRKDNPGWIIKKIHPKEKIRSIRHTAAYLATHEGLGQSERDPDSIDWDLKILDIMIPESNYSEKDHKEMSEGRGRMVGDISDFNWEEWTMKQLYTEFKIRYWGGVSRKSIRNIGTFRQYKIRVCKECGEVLRTYDGFDDSIGSFIRYIQDNPVVAFAQHAELVKMTFQRFKARLRDNDMTIIDFAKLTPFAISSLELDLPKNNDLIMETPFEEPDEYFLRRQRKAFGE
ncbi:MAG TPA: hypothetical protein VJY42_05030 [Candidatus Methanomethylophilaceae archaeon]|nr:hypothetical protein [Candidatus Methanomethylophilaceae archaeon]